MHMMGRDGRPVAGQVMREAIALATQPFISALSVEDRRTRGSARPKRKQNAKEHRYPATALGALPCIDCGHSLESLETGG